MATKRFWGTTSKPVGGQSQIICRNYLLQLEENNRYLQFLQDEFGILYTFANGILTIVDANKTLLKAMPLTLVGVNGFIDKYQEYRFLNVDLDSTLSLIEKLRRTPTQRIILTILRDRCC